MAMRIPRGYERNVPPYQELCEGVRPVDTAAPRTAYTGLPHVRIDKHHDDPIVLDPGTIVGRVNWTGAGSTLLSTVVPAVLPTGTGVAESSVVLRIKGSTEASESWNLPDGTSGDITVGLVKPIGIITQPIYSFKLQADFTNYKRNDNIGIVTDYVIMIPAINAEEHAIRDGDTVMLGSGDYYGAGWTGTTMSTTDLRAGRYARYNSDWEYANERVVGRCLKKIRIATTSTSTAGTKLNGDLDNVTLTTEATTEFQSLDKVQTVPGLGLSGSGTKGIPSFLLDATLDDGNNYPGSVKSYWALILLIRL
jgi:hypothetical protein